MIKERTGMVLKYHSGWYVRHLRKNPRTGLYEVIWEERAIDQNILHDTGEIAILTAFFATGYTDYGAPPANHYLGLDSRGSLAEADTLATVFAAEIVGKGYARKALPSSEGGGADDAFYINQPAAYYRADSEIVEWTATENWVTPQKHIFLCTDLDAEVDAANAHLICSLALSAERLLIDGDKLQGSMYIGLSEPA